MGHFESKRRTNYWLFLALPLHSNYLPPYAFVEKFQKSIKPKSGQTIIELNERINCNIFYSK